MELVFSLFLCMNVEALHLLRKNNAEHKVCLVIDNVCNNQASFDEARILLNLPFKQGSLILVTSQSFVILEKVKIKELILKIPSLSTSEARALFIHHTSCDMPSGLFEEHERRVQMFVEQCNFKVEGRDSWEYHPLALKELGTRVGPNPDE